MSTLTPVRSSPRGPARIVVRQHRRVLRIAGALALVGILALVGYALWTNQLNDSFEAGPCSVAEDPGRGCYQPVREHLDAMFQFSARLKNAGMFLAVLPGIISAFVAGPMIARELESGTYKVAWTQSVTPARWLTAKLAVPAVLMVAGTSVLSGVLAWARAQGSSDYPTYWHEASRFATTGTVNIGYTLLGIAVGALTGLLVRRTVLAMSVAALATGAVILTLGILRENLWPTLTSTNTARGDTGTPTDSWFLREGPITGSGERLPIDVCWHPKASAEAQCIAERDITGWFVDFHPSSHFWPLQLVETGILLAAAALAAALAFWVLRRRHG
jgi:hypothetical protein